MGLDNTRLSRLQTAVNSWKTKVATRRAEAVSRAAAARLAAQAARDAIAAKKAEIESLRDSVATKLGEMTSITTTVDAESKREEVRVIAESVAAKLKEAEEKRIEAETKAFEAQKAIVESDDNQDAIDAYNDAEAARVAAAQAVTDAIALKAEVDTKLAMTVEKVAEVKTTEQLNSFETLPTQSGNAGKYLTTDGTTASWVTVDSIPKGTTAERPASPTAGLLRYNTSEDVYEFFDGTDWNTWGWVPVEATGGSTSSDGTYNYHAFTYSGSVQSFTVTAASAVGATVDIFAWGAGGAGSPTTGHAGGGGGFTKVIGHPVTANTTIEIAIGGGGNPGSTGCVSNSGRGSPGTNAFGYQGGYGSNAGGSGCSRGGSGGGAATMLRTNGSIFLWAGAGGGAGGSEGGHVGAGGGAGQAGYAGNSSGSGGAAGATSSHNGIDGPTPGGDQSGGGGGGGGYRGGDYGRAPGADGQGGGGGGGGTNYYTDSGNWSGINGGGQTPGGTGESLYPGSSYAYGGGQNTAGKHGYVVIRYKVVR